MLHWSTCTGCVPALKYISPELSRTPNCVVETQPQMELLFGVADEDAHLNATKHNALAFASLLARHAVLLRWKKTAPPTHAQWLENIMSCLKLEKIRYTICGSDERFYKIWRLFLTYFQGSHVVWICDADTDLLYLTPRLPNILFSYFSLLIYFCTWCIYF